jgi:hypothetical protein
MAIRPRVSRSWLLLWSALVALSAYVGAVGLSTGLLTLSPSAAERLPFGSPVFAGVALAVVVAVPNSFVVLLARRDHPRLREASTLAGLLLVAWIAVEVAVVREFSALQVVFGLAGLGLVLTGERRTVEQVGEVVGALPLFVAAPLLRHWHLRWGATREEVRGYLPGDAHLPAAQFSATRAITIDAPPDKVWPWLVQVGFGRAGFYSYDLLDNLGRPSAEVLLPEWQHPHLGELAAPMANPPTPETSFLVAEMSAPEHLLWIKRDSTWSWLLRPLPDGRTRLITRLKEHYRRRPSALLTVALLEFGDFAMMRKMLLGLKARAEHLALDRAAEQLAFAAPGRALRRSRPSPAQFEE